MTHVQSFSSALIRTSVIALVLSVPRSWAATTSLELSGLLLDGSGNRINAPFVFATSALYSSATGGAPLVQSGQESVHVGNGSFLQVFSVDDTLLASDAYLQLSINGFTMEPRLGIFPRDSYFFASGVASGPVGHTVFQFYAGLATPAPIPEPATCATLAAGLAVLGLLLRRRPNF